MADFPQESISRERERRGKEEKERDYLTPELVNYEFEESNLKGKTTL